MIKSEFIISHNFAKHWSNLKTADGCRYIGIAFSNSEIPTAFLFSFSFTPVITFSRQEWDITSILLPSSIFYSHFWKHYFIFGSLPLNSS